MTLKKAFGRYIEVESAKQFDVGTLPSALTNFSDALKEWSEEMMLGITVEKPKRKLEWWEKV